MAINPETQYVGKIDPSSAAYPYGAPRNITVPSDGTGTPWEAALVKDLFGFQQAMLSVAGIVPSGTPDSVTESQYLTAIQFKIGVNRATLAETVADKTIREGMSVFMKERVLDGGGAGIWDVVLLTAVTPDTFGVVVCTGVPTLALVLRLNGTFLYAEQFGAPIDGGDGFAAITAALATGKEVRLGANNTYNVTDSLLLEDFKALKLEENTTLIGAVSPAVRVKGERGSLTGTNFSSVIKLGAGVASDQGIVKIGHALVTDDDAIQYNIVSTLRLIGDDPFGTSGTHTGVDTIGLMTLNLGDFNKNAPDNGFVFFNQVSRILFEDVKEAYLLTASVNAQISSDLYFRRIGEFGIHTFAPLISDAVGVRYGVNWDDATRLEGSTAENCFDRMFVDGSFKDTTGIFPIMAFIRLEYRTDTQQFTNVMDESGSNVVMTPAEGYHIDASVTDCHIHGTFNISPSGTNDSLSTSIWDLAGVSRQRTLRIDNLISDLVQVQLPGSAAVPWLFQEGSTSTGMYWPAADEIGFSDTTVERVRLGGTVPIVLTGDMSLAGDLTTRFIKPDIDNLRPCGSASFRYSEYFGAIGTINTSDARVKTPVRVLTIGELTAAKQLGAEIGIYQFLASVETKGNGARSHIGMTVQRAIEIMEDNNLDPFAYGFICFDEWDDIYEERESTYDEDGNIVKEYPTELIRDAGNLFSFRPDQLTLFICRGFEQRLSILENGA